MLAMRLPALFRHKTEPGARAPRRFHGYCVGAGKTGTHSMAGIFEKHFVSAHEPASEDLVANILQFKKGKLSKYQMLTFLRKRDEQLCLEMESNGTLAIVQDLLVECFPQSKFILTIRDCYSWLDSVMNHNIASAPSGFWIEFDDIKYGSTIARLPTKERALSVRGLRSLDDYLSHWSNHINDIIRLTPSSRLLVLRIDHLDRSVNEIAEFLGIDPGLIDISRSHLFRNPKNFGIVEEIGAQYIEAKVKEHCSELMEKFFPDIPSIEAAFKANR
jgi:hypothetical protein